MYWSLHLVSTKEYLLKKISEHSESDLSSLLFAVDLKTFNLAFLLETRPLSCPLASCREIMYFTALSLYKCRPGHLHWPMKIQSEHCLHSCLIHCDTSCNEISSLGGDKSTPRWCASQLPAASSSLASLASLARRKGVRLALRQRPDLTEEGWRKAIPAFPGRCQRRGAKAVRRRERI